MNDRQRLIDELVSDEGVRLKPYSDSGGHLTIGVGRNLTGKGLSSREAFDLLDHDVDEAVADLAGSFPWFVTLDAVRQRAVVNLRFNVGPVRFRTFHKFIAAMAAGDYAEAEQQLVKSRWITQVQKSRSHRMRRQIATGTDL